MKKMNWLLIVLAMAVVGQCYGQTATADPNAPAQDSADGDFKNIWTRPKLTGEWYGLRSDLADMGITLDLRLSQYYQSVTSGGSNTNGAYGGTMDYRLHLDGGKLGLWEGFSIDMHARSRFGRDVSADAGALSLENTGMLMPATGDYQQTDITGLTASYTFPFFAGRLGNVTVGKLDVIDLLTGFFPSIGCGQEGFMNANGQVSALPWFGSIQGLSLYGGYLMTINTEYKTAESGFLAVGTENVSTSWGSLSSSFDEGTFLGGFHRFFWGDVDDKMGYFMVFAGGSTRDQASNDPHDYVDIPGQGIENTTTHKPWDIALYVYQDIWRDADNPNRKANVMIGGSLYEDNPQFAQYNIFGNVEAFGLMTSRPHDRMGVAAWYNVLSDNFKDDVSLVVDVCDTWGSEVYYNIQVNPWLHVTPNIQLSQNAQDDDDMAVILGLRAVMDF
jgi:porin